MSSFGQPIFSGSRFVFWSVAPVALVTGVTLPFLIDDWNATRIALMVAFELAIVFLVLALYDPKRFRWPARALMAMVFLFYLAFFLAEIVSNPQSLTQSDPKGDTSAGDALLGLLAIGLPALGLAVFGRYAPRRPQLSDTEPEDHGDRSIASAEGPPVAPAGRRRLGKAAPGGPQLRSLRRPPTRIPLLAPIPLVQGIELDDVTVQAIKDRTLQRLPQPSEKADRRLGTLLTVIMLAWILLWVLGSHWLSAYVPIFGSTPWSTLIFLMITAAIVFPALAWRIHWHRRRFITAYRHECCASGIFVCLNCGYYLGPGDAPPRICPHCRVQKTDQPIAPAGGPPPA